MSNFYGSFNAPFSSGPLGARVVDAIGIEKQRALMHKSALLDAMRRVALAEGNLSEDERSMRQRIDYLADSAQPFKRLPGSRSNPKLLLLLCP